MSAPDNYPNGIGGIAGADLALAKPLTVSGSIWYVNAATGTDAAGARGRERIRPLATLAQAHTNASAGDIIVCLEGHAETLTGSQSFNKAGIVVLGEGQGSTRPHFTRSGDIYMFDVTADGVEFNNLFFPGSIATISTKARVRMAGIKSRVIGCYFECAATYDTGPGLSFNTGAAQVSVLNTYFVSTSTSTATQPDSGLEVTAPVVDFEMDSCVFDGGSSGWSDPYAFVAPSSITRLRATNIDLLHDSDAYLTTSTSGWWTTRNSSGSARVVWLA